MSWAEPGVGVVATQSVVEPAYGPKGLGQLRRGASAPDALRRLLGDDENAAVRQVAIVDKHGRAAVHTGPRCIREAGHRVADGVSAQANMMKRPTVPDAMIEAFRATQGELSRRLLAALEAAEREGGDIRGRQSAAMLVVAPRATGAPMADTPIDLRVDDHPDPVAELRRLIEVHSAYAHIETADELAARGDLDGALDEYRTAHAKQPTNPELTFWHGVTLAANGREEEARTLLRPVFEHHDGWRELLRRLPDSGLFPADQDLIARLAGPHVDEA